MKKTLIEHLDFYIRNEYVFDSVKGFVYHKGNSEDPESELRYDTWSFIFPCELEHSEIEYSNEEINWFKNKIIEMFPYLKDVLYYYSK